MSKEIMQQALDALEYHTVQTRPIDKTNEAIEALRQALAQPEQWTPVEIGVDVTPEGTHVVGMYVLMPDAVRHVFYSKFHPAPVSKSEQEPEQELVAWMEMVVANLVRLGVVKHKAKELAYHFYTYDPPCKRKWVGLTDEEIESIAKALFDDAAYCSLHFAVAIEAKLREKNT